MSEDLVFSHETYLSPFTWRYGSDAMRGVWSEVHKRRLWRRIWVALAEAEGAAGLVSDAQVADLRRARRGGGPGSRPGHRARRSATT